MFQHVSWCLLYFVTPGAIRRSDLIYRSLFWLVVEPYPSDKWWSSSMGRMTTHIWNGKIKHVPNHQPVLYIHIIYTVYIHMIRVCIYIIHAIYVYVCVYVCVCVYMCLCICMRMCICIQLYIYVLCYICNVPIPKLWQHSPRRLHPTP